MKDNRFHPMSVSCPTCKQESAVLSVSFSVSGAILLGLICVTCGIELNLLTSWDKIICFCHEKESIQQATVFEGVSTVQ